MRIHNVSPAKPYTWTRIGPHVILVRDGIVVFKIPVEDVFPIGEALHYWLDIEMRDKQFFSAEVLTDLIDFIATHDMELQEYLDTEQFQTAATNA